MAASRAILRTDGPQQAARWHANRSALRRQKLRRSCGSWAEYTLDVFGSAAAALRLMTSRAGLRGRSRAVGISPTRFHQARPSRISQCVAAAGLGDAFQFGYWRGLRLSAAPRTTVTAPLRVFIDATVAVFSRLGTCRSGYRHAHSREQFSSEILLILRILIGAVAQRVTSLLAV